MKTIQQYSNIVDFLNSKKEVHYEDIVEAMVEGIPKERIKIVRNAVIQAIKEKLNYDPTLDPDSANQVNKFTSQLLKKTEENESLKKQLEEMAKTEKPVKDELKTEDKAKGDSPEVTALTEQLKALAAKIETLTTTQEETIKAQKKQSILKKIEKETGKIIPPEISSFLPYTDDDSFEETLTKIASALPEDTKPTLTPNDNLQLTRGNIPNVKPKFEESEVKKAVSLLESVAVSSDPQENFATED